MTKKSDSNNRQKDNNKNGTNNGRRKKLNIGQLLWHLASFAAALGCVVLAMFLKQPVAWAMGTKGGLLGEELLDSHDKARDYADRSIQEALALWSEPPSNWQVVYNATSSSVVQKRATTTSQQQDNPLPLVVECRRITEGPYENSTIHVARAEGILRGIGAQEAYDFMVSKEGFAIIDPGSDPNDFGNVIEQIPEWREDSSSSSSRRARTQIEEAHMPPTGPFAERDFVVLNSFVPEERIFVSKSVLHRSRPGASPYYAGEIDGLGDDDNNKQNIKRNAVRALNTFAIQTESKTLENNEVVVNVKMINYIDLHLNAALMSHLSCKYFFPDLYKKFQKVFDEGAGQRKESR